MKNLIFTFLISLISQSANAQYEIDWANAPMNPILQTYTRNHNKILGNVASRREGSIEWIFNKNGTMLLTKSLMPFKYFYDHKGYLNSQQTDMGTYTFICDENGRVIQMAVDNVPSLKFTFNDKGLWTGLTDLKSGNIEKNYYYDERGRIIKEEGYEKGKLNITILYSYAIVNKILEVKIVWNQPGKPSGANIQKFNDRGDCIWTHGKAIKYTYDHHNNILSIDDGAYPNVYSYTYFDEISKNPGTKITQKPDCISGDCENGYGFKKIGNFNYTGFFENGKPDGPGVLSQTNYLLISVWKSGINTGYGIFTQNETGDRAQGYFENLVLNGRGLRNQNGKFQYGRFSAGNLVLPAYKIERTSLSTGCIFGDCTQKYGVYLFRNGGKYTGFFKDGNPETGIFSDTKKNKYTGEYKDGKKDGFGHQLFPNGDICVGYYKNGMRNGKGLYQLKGTPTREVIGFWEDDKLVKNMTSVSVMPDLLQPTPPGPGLIKEPITSETKIAQKADCISGDCENGYGIKKIGDKKHYGFFVNGKQEGPGALIGTNYTFYSNWENGVNKGFGMLMEGKNSVQGYFLNNLLNGTGAVNNDGIFQYGSFSSGNLIQPAYKFDENKNLIGCIMGNCTNLYGSYLFPNSSRFIGFFEKSKPRSGIFIDAKKNQYVGEFNTEGNKHGIGNQMYSNKDNYFGNFKNGKRHGKGSYIIEGPPEQEIVGIWENDDLVKDLSPKHVISPVFQPTPPGPGIISNQNTSQNKTKDKFDDLGFGDAVPDLNTMNNTVAIARLYPGYPGSDKKFIANKISVEAARKGSEDASVKYIAEKIEELYSLNKNVAFDAFLYIKPSELTLKALKLASPETRKYMFAEVKRIQREYLQKHPEGR